jgi:hypothetical protein
MLVCVDTLDYVLALEILCDKLVHDNGVDRDL